MLDKLGSTHEHTILKRNAKHEAECAIDREDCRGGRYRGDRFERGSGHHARAFDQGQLTGCLFFGDTTLGYVANNREERLSIALRQCADRDFKRERIIAMSSAEELVLVNGDFIARRKYVEDMDVGLQLWIGPEKI